MEHLPCLLYLYIFFVSYKFTMTEDFRTTGKFKPLGEEKIRPASIGTLIELRQLDPTVEGSSTIWRRISSEMKEELGEKTASLQYQCTYLDHECVIEVEYESLRMAHR